MLDRHSNLFPSVKQLVCYGLLCFFWLNIVHIQCDLMVLPCQVLTLSAVIPQLCQQDPNENGSCLEKGRQCLSYCGLGPASFLFQRRYEELPNGLFVAKVFPVASGPSPLQLLLLGMLGQRRSPTGCIVLPSLSLAVQRPAKLCTRVTLLTHTLEAASGSALMRFNNYASRRKKDLHLYKH